MATSGSVDFSRTRDEIITHALQVAKVLAEGATASSQQLTDGAAYLNMVCKWLQADGMPLWALKTAYVLPVSDTNSIVAGGSTHVVHSYTQTQLSAAASSGASTISVDSATGFGASQVVGIELSDGTIQWTTQSGAASGTTITLADVLTGAASEDGVVYTYATTVRAYRPLRIVHAVSTDVVDDTEQTIEIISHQEYTDLGSKTAEGYPTQLYYDPQLTSATIYFYPRFQDGRRVINFRYHRPFEDFDATGDTPDFPQEWYMPLVWLLAWALAGMHGMPLQERKLLLEEAIMLKNVATSGTSQEEDSVQFIPSPWHQ
jgi:hypothetical protein